MVEQCPDGKRDKHIVNKKILQKFEREEEYYRGKECMKQIVMDDT